MLLQKAKLLEAHKDALQPVKLLNQWAENIDTDRRRGPPRVLRAASRPRKALASKKRERKRLTLIQFYRFCSYFIQCYSIFIILHFESLFFGEARGRR